MRVKIYPGQPHGFVVAPSSKSMAHRAILAAALANGESRITNVAKSQDICATLQAVTCMGASVKERDGEIVVRGIEDVFASLADKIFCRESGSTLRFLLPVATLSGKEVAFTGEGRLLARPQDVYEEMYISQGHTFYKHEDVLKVKGRLQAGTYKVAGDISSQFITGLLYALPLLGGDSTIIVGEPFESRPYVAMTLEVLEKFGVLATSQGGNILHIKGGQVFAPANYAIEGDYSQAAFFFVLGAICSPVAVMGLRENSTQGDSRIIEYLRACGARFEKREEGIQVLGGELKGRELDLADCPDLGPILMTLGAFCAGEMRLVNAQRLRMKESDRITAMERELEKCGVMMETTKDTISIFGKKGGYSPKEVLYGHNDHRVVMSLAVFAAGCNCPVVIDGAEAINKSYPAFFEDVQKLGIEVETL